ncbi:MAG: sugar transferase [Candidatus Gottesmanbacteria bacterium]
MFGFFMYRIFIIFFCVAAIPIAVIVTIAIIVFSGLPIIFCQKRVGKDGKIFTMYKFRTMKIHADRQQMKLRSKNEADGPVFKIYHDPRHTTIGAFLSHTGLDELPQLVNIIVGDMALFGPRPLPIKEVHTLLPWQEKRHTIKPGIISPWVLDGYHRRTFNEWMKSDCMYVQHKSFIYDTRLFFRSLFFIAALMLQEIRRSNGGVLK